METKRSITYTINLAPGLTTIFIVFLLLKVFGYVTWSWWLVTLPMWLMPAIILAAAIFALVVLVLAGIGIFFKEMMK